MNAILLSIKPEYVKKIFSLEKKYELRKVIFKEKNVKRILIYESFPIKKIVGEFLIDGIIKDSPDNIFRKYKKEIGISKKEYNKYFEGKQDAYAIKIGRVKKYKKALSLEDLSLKRAPQSFQYIDSNTFKNI